MLQFDDGGVKFRLNLSLRAIVNGLVFPSPMSTYIADFYFGKEMLL
jgi:hypothetical protein